MIYNFDKFDIVVDDSNMILVDDRIIGLYFIPVNMREVVTKEEIHNAIDYVKDELNIENNANGVWYHKKA